MTNTDATEATAPWSGHLSCDLRNGTLAVSMNAMVLIDNNDVAWATVLPDAGGFYNHAALIVRAVNRDTQFEAMVGALEELRHDIELRLSSRLSAKDYLMGKIDAALSNIQASK